MTPSAKAPSIGKALEPRIPKLIAAWRDDRSRSASSKVAPLSGPELDRVGAALLRLQRGLTGKRALAGAPYMDESDLLGAYLLYYWPVSYIEVSLILGELGLRPRRILDLGSGPGPAAAAALDAGASSIRLADASERALELAARALGAGSTRLQSGRIDLESGDALDGIDGSYDLIIMSHCLNELWRERDDRIALRAELASKAAKLLSPGGILVAIEPALLATSRDLLALGDELAAEGYPILGPCPSRHDTRYPCPALASGPDRTCHMEAAWAAPEPIASLAGRAGLDRISVKFSWLAIGAAGDAAGDAAAAETGVEAEAAGRVISDPMLNKAGRIRYVLCSGGSLVTISAAKDSPQALRSGFLSLKRGDRIEVREAEARPGGGLGLGPDSILEIIAAARRIDP